MKKQLLAGLAAGLLICCMSGLAQASLTTIGTATYLGSDYNLIWDDDNNGNSVVWLDYTNPAANKNSQNTWAAGLNAALIYNVDPSFSLNWEEDTWRLPSVGINPDVGYNQTSSEIGHLYYVELGLQSYPDNGNVFTTTSELNATNFDNLDAATFGYWCAEASGPSYSYGFSVARGRQFSASVGSTTRYGLAIRAGQVASAVPVPGAIWLLGPGLAGLIGLRRKK